jgi:hypothetical protein
MRETTHSACRPFSLTLGRSGAFVSGLKIRETSADDLARMHVDEASPLRCRLVIDHDVRLGEEGLEQLLDTKLAGRLPGVSAAAGAAGVELSALRREISNAVDRARHGYALRPRGPDEGVIDVT